MAHVLMILLMKYTTDPVIYPLSMKLENEMRSIVSIVLLLLLLMMMLVLMSMQMKIAITLSLQILQLSVLVKTVMK